MKTEITKTADSTVTLKARDPLSGENIICEYSIPTFGGHISDAHGKQVCVRLSNRGHTLTATDGDDLLKVIRAEWAAYRAAHYHIQA